MRLWPLSARQPIRYNIASMMPQARLHPSAPMSIVRTSSRPAWATLSDPVNVRTMITPKRTSETRSIGSRTRLELYCIVDRKQVGVCGSRVHALGVAAGTASWRRWRRPSAAGRREPGRAPAVGHQPGGERGDEHHHHGAGQNCRFIGAGPIRSSAAPARARRRARSGTRCPARCPRSGPAGSCGRRKTPRPFRPRRRPAPRR